MEIIAELGINHNGNLEIAKKMIDVAYAAGCNYVKFQKRTIDLVYTKKELDKPRESPWGTTTREQKEGLEFDQKAYEQIDNYCKEKIQWFASVWDKQSLMFCSEFKIPFIKVPSALITNEDYLEDCRITAFWYRSCGFEKPIILSTGMSTLQEVDRAIEILGKDGIYCIMACTSTYPTEPKEINIECIPVLKKRYPWTKIGFSNHYPGLMAMTLAAAYGAEMLEFHISLDRSMYGSDQAASIEPQGVFRLMEYIRLIEQMKGDGVKRIYQSEMPIMSKLRRNL